jgi:ribosome-associated protein
VKVTHPRKESMINASRSDGPAVDRLDPTELNPERILAAAAELAADRKAEEIVALDLRGIVGYADYMLVCSGRSDRQVKAIHDAIHAGLKARLGLLPRRVEGLTEGRWVLIDLLDVVVHVFTPETREHYRLEQLWGEAPRVELEALAV